MCTFSTRFGMRLSTRLTLPLLPPLPLHATRSTLTLQVDRGPFGLEVALTLFAFKILYPLSVNVSRGNHEEIFMNV